MAERYTAADFANARYAEHPDGRIAARLQTEEARPWESVRDFHTDEGMAADGWAPVPSKPTITESQARELFESVASCSQTPSTFNFEIRAIAGIEIIPDPEPTNTERLEKALTDYALQHGGMRGGVDEIAAHLDSLGITAPNVKDN